MVEKLTETTCAEWCIVDHSTDDEFHYGPRRVVSLPRDTAIPQLTEARMKTHPDELTAYLGQHVDDPQPTIEMVRFNAEHDLDAYTKLTLDEAEAFIAVLTRLVAAGRAA
ncbi:DUF6907 domain-containing protein [Actinomadura sp. HBU206391]|uniref:DUF6907 domain-containing protein n=1 Tax=Actinomadura sp. HBU206391 TaxID=2731692 RepID=UPI00164FA887|nr:hypothetical protein [Actinomadura sp. HBU206391]MBC6458443.1 hypothetical protein [Actinomadura sp. HBU206391]